MRNLHPGVRFRTEWKESLSLSMIISTLLKSLTSTLKTKTEFFVPMAAASNNTPDSAEQTVVSLLCEFPTRRAGRRDFSTDELRLVLALLDTYVASTSKRTAATKVQLAADASSLLPPGSNALSSKWNKCQLAYTTRKWVIEAESLDSSHKQRDLFLEVRTSDTDPKALDHDVFILEDDGSVTQFSVASPQPVGAPASGNETSESGRIRSIDGGDSAQVPASPTDLFSPISIATSASSFVRHLNELVESTEPALAVIETFPRPRVGNSSPKDLAPDQPTEPGA